MNNISTEALQEIAKIAAQDGKFYAMKKTMNFIAKMKDNADMGITSAKKERNFCSLYDDLSTESEYEYFLSKGKSEIIQHIFETLNPEIVIENSRILGKMKKKFKTNFPEYTELLQSTLKEIHKQREKDIQNKLKIVKNISTYGANLSCAVFSLLKNNEELQNEMKTKFPTLFNQFGTQFFIKNYHLELERNRKIIRQNPSCVTELISLSTEVIPHIENKNKINNIINLMNILEKWEQIYVQNQ